MPEEKSKPKPAVAVSVMPKRKGWKNQLPALAVILVVIVVLVVVYFVRKTTSNNTPLRVNLLFASSSSDKMTVTDSADKQLYQLNFPFASNPNFVAVAPDGQLITSVSAGSSQESFILAKDNKPVALSDKTMAALRSATVIDASNQMAFSDNNTFIYVACPDTCKLTSLNVGSGETKTVADTGVKSTFLPAAYLLGLSSDKKSAFVHVIGANKLGTVTNAIYQVDLSTGKVQKEIKTSFETGYDVALSPDSKNYAYWTTDTKGDTSLHVVDISTGKDTAVKWAKDSLGGTPTALNWSPDGTKVLFASAHITLPRSITGSPRNTEIAYLDVSKKTITNLQTVNDQSKTMVTYIGWLDNNTIVYNQQSASSNYDFTNVTNQAYEQTLTSKTAQKLDNRQLISVFRY